MGKGATDKIQEKMRMRQFATLFFCFDGATCIDMFSSQIAMGQVIFPAKSPSSQVMSQSTLKMVCP